MRKILTERIFESSLDCMYKCRLLLNGRHGNKTEYEEHIRRFAAMYQRAAIARLQELNPETKIAYAAYPLGSGDARFGSRLAARGRTRRH